MLGVADVEIFDSKSTDMDIFTLFHFYHDCFRLDVISGVVVEKVGLDVRVNIG